MASIKSNRIFLFNFIVLSGIIFYIYFNSPLRPEMEKKFYVVKNYISSFFGSTKNVVVVEVTEDDVKLLRPNAKDLYYSDLQKIIQTVLSKHPKTVTALLHSQVFKLDDPERLKLFKYAQDHKNVFFGVFDYERDNILEISKSGVEKFVFSAATYPTYKEHMLIKLPAQSKNQGYAHLFILPQLAKVIDPDAYSRFEQFLSKVKPINDIKYFQIRYYRPESLQKITVSDLLNKNNKIDLTDKNIMIGYSAFRNFDFRVAEATFVNTPFQPGEGDVYQGVPLVYVMANGLDNILTSKYVRTISKLLNVFQVIFVCLLIYLIWQLPMRWVMVALGIGLLALLLFQSVFLGLFSLDIPSSDVIMFGLFVALSSSLYRSSKEMESRLREQELISAKSEVIDLQESFLNDLSQSLNKTNIEIDSLLGKHRDYFEADQDIREIYLNTRVASQELNDYLHGVQQFLDVNRRGIKLHFRSVHIRDAIENVLKRFSSRIESKNQRVDLDLPDVEFETDPTLFDQIIHNLISNAVKYSPENTKISISGNKINKKLFIVVRDNGPGIDAAEQEKIFEKFYRIQDDNVYKVKGSGLGLYLSRFFAQQIRGDISVKSKLGEGASFTLTLEGV